MSEQIKRDTISELARQIRLIAIQSPNRDTVSNEFGNWFTPKVEQLIASVILPSVMRSLLNEKILPYLERLQHMLESGETYCFDNEFDLADAKDLRALINELWTLVSESSGKWSSNL